MSSWYRVWRLIPTVLLLAAFATVGSTFLTSRAPTYVYDAKTRASSASPGEPTTAPLAIEDSSRPRAAAVVPNLRSNAATGFAAERTETELVQRAMSRAELQATQETGLIRGGREGTNYVSDNVNSNALRARQRLVLPQTPEVRVTLEVPRGAFSPPKLVDPLYDMPGGGMERMGTGQIACRVVAVLDYC
jgi:hypothetical protein